MRKLPELNGQGPAERFLKRVVLGICPGHGITQGYDYFRVRHNGSHPFNGLFFKKIIGSRFSLHLIIIIEQALVPLDPFGPVFIKEMGLFDIIHHSQHHILKGVGGHFDAGMFGQIGE